METKKYQNNAYLYRYIHSHSKIYFCCCCCSLFPPCMKITNNLYNVFINNHRYMIEIIFRNT